MKQGGIQRCGGRWNGDEDKMGWQMKIYRYQELGREKMEKGKMEKKKKRDREIKLNVQYVPVHYTSVSNLDSLNPDPDPAFSPNIRP
jgi:hypothetical protein